MASQLDPLGLWRATSRLASLAEREVAAIVRSLREAAEPPQGAAALPRASEDSLQEKMSHLLTRALGQSTKSSRTELFHKILDQLVPDEARILGALSDGSKTPMINVFALSATGMKGDALLEHAALVGKTANVALGALTPTYISHLLALGLLEIGPEDTSLKEDYQILQADPQVLKAMKRGSRGPLAAKTERYTITLSAFGRQFWAATTEGAE